ncbi:MAG: pyrF [Solirubrobacterales bacterium]|nr:pyrF [Solirubrobacterales bacterium]
MSTPDPVAVDRQVLAGDLARGGYLRGAFAHPSGATSRWFETELVLARPGVLHRCAELLAATIDPRADRLAARGPAAVALASALALRTDLTLLLESRGEPATAFTGDLFPGARVVLVEDVVMTGTHALASVAALAAAGVIVSHVVTVVDREHGGRAVIEQAGVAMTALFTETELAP